MGLAAGDRLGRYEILDPLGAGGMGEVYRARDTDLERDVAIKVLPEAVSQSRDRLERFRREAKAVAKLAHPNILEIWDYGSQGGLTYAVTELLNGDTLRDRLAAGPFGWRKAAEIGAAIADGMAAAHEAGIVHRDLKPSNVFLTADGRVKVLDFGLARYDPEETGNGETAIPTQTGLTDPGSVLGTVGYMSPEQLNGRPADPRSDIFSLGCVLYEMTSGQKPFVRDTAAETIAAVLREQPQELSTTCPLLPQGLERTIQRCLEKRPGSRFQSASDLAYSLRSISTETQSGHRLLPRVKEQLSRRIRWPMAAIVVAAATAGIVLWIALPRQPSSPQVLVQNRVAISPFENRTGDPALDGFGDMAADLITQSMLENRLAEALLLGGGVAAADSSPDTPPRRSAESTVGEAARGLGAGLLITGAYYEVEDGALRIQASLGDVSTGQTLYACQPASAQRASPAEAVRLIQDCVVAAVATYLDPALDVTVIRPPSSLAAFLEWRRAREAAGTDNARAEESYRRAIGLDPSFAVALIGTVSTRSARDDYTGARAALSSAENTLRQLTPFERAWLSYWKAYLDVNLVAAHRFSHEMLDKAPQLPWVRMLVGSSAVWLGRPREAIDILTEGASGNPRPLPIGTSPQAFRNVIDAHHLLGDYRSELESANAVLRDFSDVEDSFRMKARALVALGEVDRAFDVIDEALSTPLGRSIWERAEDIAVTASELRAHGYQPESVRMAEKTLAWFKAHPIEQSASTFDRFWYEHFRIYALRVAGRWDEAGQRLQELTAAYPDELRFAAVAGIVAARKGDPERARHALDNVLPLDHLFWPAWHSYWRAAIAAHLGEKERAVNLLRDAFSNGERHSGWHHQSIDLEPLWDYPPFQELIKPKG